MFKFLPTRSVFFPLTLLSLAFLLLLLSCLLFYLTRNLVQSLNDGHAITTRLTSQSVMEKIDRNFYERFGDVQAFAFNRLAVSAAESDSIVPGIQEFVNTMTAYYVLYDLMLVCDRNGKVLVVNTVDKNGKAVNTSPFNSKDFSNASWFAACMSDDGPKGGAWYSDFTRDTEIGRIYGHKGYGMAFAAPIRNSDGTTVGVWYNFASWADVTDGIREEAEKNLASDHPGSWILVLKPDGEVISARNNELIGSRVKLDNEKSIYPLEGSIGGASASRGAYTYAGKGWVTATFIPAETVSWSVFFSGQNLTAIILCIVLIGGFSFLIYKYFRKNIISGIDELQHLQLRLSQGEILSLATSGKQGNEFQDMKYSLSLLAGSLKDKAAFADEISKGNFNAALSLASEKDKLGESLVNMQSQLIAARNMDDERSWAAEALARIAAILRSGEASGDLYNRIIKFLVTYMGANQGGLFLLMDSENNEKVLRMVSCYAYDKKRFVQKEFSPEEGLLGQAILEKQTIYLKEIPESYIHITSGLGEALPKNVLIVPLKINDVVFGVYEIASFNLFRESHVKLAENLAESIAGSLNAIQQAEKTTILLRKMQYQTEEMKSQEEEMRQNMEELSATQEEMMRKEKEYVARISALERMLYSDQGLN